MTQEQLDKLSDWVLKVDEILIEHTKLIKQLAERGK